MKQLNSDTCRLCYSDIPLLISPCNCKGSQKYIHVSCLIDWITSVSPQALINKKPFQCPVCNYDINYENFVGMVEVYHAVKKTVFTNINKWISEILFIITFSGVLFLFQMSSHERSLSLVTSFCQIMALLSTASISATKTGWLRKLDLPVFVKYVFGAAICLCLCVFSSLVIYNLQLVGAKYQFLFSLSITCIAASL